jgi:D-serine deaminase-like pyridoxal phosphate-dependent protein
MNPCVNGCPKSHIDTPALLIEMNALGYNIRKMAGFFKDKETKLRPHVKTHKSPTIALKQLKEGPTRITCQKISEAEVMARAGIRDILIANQVVSKKKIRRLVELARDKAIKVAVDSSQNIEDLSHEFGMPILEVDNRRLELSSLAEEHGIIKHPIAAESMNVGDVVELIPTHGCTTINLHDFLYGIRKGVVKCVWPIEGRGEFH